MRTLRATAVVGLTAAYLGHLFAVTQPAFWTAGLGDWLDPYFINYLLEHWYVALTSAGDPSSPPMFHPTVRVLGYSHGLILYAPFYVALRAVAHPFVAYNLTILLVMAVGSLSLYVLLRTTTVPFTWSVLLAAWFVTSPNVTDALTGTWSQRASVFLVPPLLLAAITSWRRRDDLVRRLVAAAVGIGAALLFVQEFYTALFAWAFGLAALPFAWSSADAGIDGRAGRRWLAACALGATAGALVFAWIYLPAYREHQAFPERELLASLVQVPSWRWPHVVSLVREHPAFASWRPFVLAAALTVVAAMPATRLDRTTRLLCVSAGVLSLAVLLVPYRFGTFSPWRSWFGGVPGFAVVRDPKRIIYVFELFVVLVAARLVSRLRTRSLSGIALGVGLAAMLVLDRNPVVYEYHRPTATFAWWVERDVAIDPACRAFYIEPASATYASRPHAASTLHALDAMFIALRTGVPTLNGYSAWEPAGWGLADPREPGYRDAVRGWIDDHHLEGVCALDIEARTMRPMSIR